MIARLETHALTEEQITELKASAATVVQDLETIRDDFESCRRLIEMFNVQITPKVEDGEKVIYVSCHFGEKSLYFQHNSTIRIGNDYNKKHLAQEMGRKIANPGEEVCQSNTILTTL